jgi:starch phosphorylase
MDEMTKASAVPHRPEDRGFAVRFSGEADALFERHLRFDSVVDPAAAGARDKFEAAAHAVRDMLTQRWIQTQQTYDRENPKRVYYLSMEFLIGRSLTNNITNLMLHSVVGDAARAAGLDWIGLIEQEPDAGLGNGGLGRLAACFLDSMATMQLRQWGMACAMNTGCSGRPSRTGGNVNIPTIGCVARIHGRSLVPARPWRSN